jgi:8-oxo-dGTP diphosphatase
MRNHVPVAVHLFFFREDKVLILRRYNTGWEDGNYSVVAGHVEAGETVTGAAIREAREEVGVDLAPQDLSMIHVMNRKSEDERIDFFFVVRRWTGEVANVEPDKCDELAWCPISSLPNNIIPYIQQALIYYRKGVFFSEFGW